MKVHGGRLVLTTADEVKVGRLGKPKFDEGDHPRDRLGRFVEVGGTVSIRGGGTATVLETVGGGRVKVRRDADQREVVVDAGLTTQIRSAAQNESRRTGAPDPAAPPADAPETPAEPVTPEQPRVDPRQVVSGPSVTPEQAPTGTVPAPEADPTAAIAHLRTADGTQAAWLSEEGDGEHVGYMRTIADDPATTVRFTTAEAWAADADTRGMDETDEIPAPPVEQPDGDVDPATLGTAEPVVTPVDPTQRDGFAPSGAEARTTLERDAATAAPEHVRAFFGDGLGDEVATFREAGGDSLAQRSELGAETVDATERAAKQAKIEIAADISDRLRNLPPEAYLSEADQRLVADLDSGKSVYLRIPHDNGRIADPANPTPGEQIMAFDYREIPADRYTQLLAEGATLPEGLERVTGDQWRDWKRNERVSTAVNLWSVQSNGTNATALAMQDTAAELFGMDGVADWPAFADYPDLRAQTKEAQERNRAFDEAFLLAQYDATQDRFREQGITHVELFRGFRTYDDSPEWMLTEGPSEDVTLRPLSSFTSDPEGLAGNFARDSQGNEGVVISGVVPVERIIGSARTGFGSLSEAEFVVMAGPGEWNVRSTSEADGPGFDDWDPLGGGPDDFYYDEDGNPVSFDELDEEPEAPAPSAADLPIGLLATPGELAAAIGAATDPDVRQQLMNRAGALGMAHLIPTTWRPDGSEGPQAGPDWLPNMAEIDEADLIAALSYEAGTDRMAQAQIDAARAELTRRADIVAGALLDRYSKVEPQITAGLTAMAEAAGGRMEGLDFRLKARDSLARKLRDKSIDKGITQAEYGNKINDAVRYTMLVEPGNYAQTTQRVLDQFRAEGYEVVDDDNTWTPGAIYKGVNSVMRAPDGTLFELQFHTPQSFDVKMGQHEDYELMRDPERSKEEQYEAYQRMRANWEGVEVPEGIETVGTLLDRGNPFEARPQVEVAPDDTPIG